MFPVQLAKKTDNRHVRTDIKVWYQAKFVNSAENMARSSNRTPTREWGESVYPTADSISRKKTLKFKYGAFRVMPCEWSVAGPYKLIVSHSHS